MNTDIWFHWQHPFLPVIQISLSFFPLSQHFAMFSQKIRGTCTYTVGSQARASTPSPPILNSTPLFLCSFYLSFFLPAFFFFPLFTSFSGFFFGGGAPLARGVYPPLHRWCSCTTWGMVGAPLGRGRGRGRGPGRGRGRGIRVPIRKRLSKRACKSKPDNPLQVRLLW